MLNTFSTGFNAQSVDLSHRRQGSFSWFLWAFFGKRALAGNVVLNGDGSITLRGDVTGPNGQIATVTPTGTPGGFVGHAFGGGAYIEAELKFDPQEVISSGGNGWPAFWAMSAEHLTAGNEQWVGRPEGYKHFIEVDILEYAVVQPGEPLHYYAVNLHDWYGIYNRTCPGQHYCRSFLPYHMVKVEVPESTRFSDYHRYGFLWIPATPGVQGLGRFYFDGEKVGSDIRWEKLPNHPGPPDHQPWRFAIMDRQHLVLILGTGPNQRMTVRSVNVWQKSDAHNLRYSSVVSPPARARLLLQESRNSDIRVKSALQ